VLDWDPAAWLQPPEVVGIETLPRAPTGFAKHFLGSKTRN